MNPKTHITKSGTMIHVFNPRTGGSESKERLKLPHLTKEMISKPMEVGGGEPRYVASKEEY